MFTDNEMQARRVLKALSGPDDNDDSDKASEKSPDTNSKFIKKLKMSVDQVTTNVKIPHKLPSPPLIKMKKMNHEISETGTYSMIINWYF